MAAALRGKGYESLLPCHRGRRRASEHLSETDLPLFPAYVFCRFDPSRRLPVLVTPGVRGVVGFGGGPEPVDAGEMASLLALVRSGRDAEPWPYVRRGDRVRIEYGSLRGVEGTLVEVRNQCRVVLSITLFMRSVAVEVRSDWVRRLPEAAGPADRGGAYSLEPPGAPLACARPCSPPVET